MNHSLLRHRADYVGITGSVLCIIHCLITPVLVLTSAFMQNDALRFGFVGLDYVFIGINIVAVWFASRHTSPLIRTGMWSCLALFAAGILLEEVSELAEYLAYAASLGLVSMHLLNIRYCRLHHRH